MRLEGWATSRWFPPFETRQSAGVTPRDAAAPQGEVDSSASDSLATLFPICLLHLRSARLYNRTNVRTPYEEEDGRMLSTERNAILPRVGPGTPTGELMREYWIPACLPDELKPDAAPTRIKL